MYRKVVSSAAASAMIAAYQGGATMAKAAAQFGFSHKTCANVIRRAGIMSRTRREAFSLRRKHPFNERFFQTIDSEEKAYWLGFISADGCVYWPDRVLSVLLARTDKEHLRSLCAALGASGDSIRDSSYKRDGRTHLTACAKFFSSQLLDDLGVLGVVPRKSLVVCPWDGPESLMAHYWRGVFDGDGSIHRKSDGYWGITQVGSFGIVQGFSAFVSQVVGKMKVPKSAGKIFNVAYQGTGLPQLIAHLLYDNASVFLPRKQALATRLFAESVRHPYGSRRDFSELTADDLTTLREEHGSWAEVGRALDVASPALLRMRKRCGLSAGPTGRPPRR